MKYYVTIIKTTNDEQTSKSIYEYGSENEAIGNFHSEMGKAMKDKNVKACLCIAYNSIGGIYKNENYIVEGE